MSSHIQNIIRKYNLYSFICQSFCVLAMRNFALFSVKLHCRKKIHIISFPCHQHSNTEQTDLSSLTHNCFFMYFTPISFISPLYLRAYFRINFSYLFSVHPIFRYRNNFYFGFQYFKKDIFVLDISCKCCIHEKDFSCKTWRNYSGRSRNFHYELLLLYFVTL